MTMLPPDGQAVTESNGLPATGLERVLRSLSIITMLMTVPQVWAIWTTNASGVSLISWAAYLVSSVAWLFYGIKKQDALICFANAGWVGLDLAIIAGIVVRH